MLLPGFVESHLHLGLGGSELTDLQLGKAHDYEELRAAFLASWAEPAVLRIEHILQAARAEFQKPGMAEALRSLDVNEATLRQPMRQAAA